jgi:hypothetical protein
VPVSIKQLGLIFAFLGLIFTSGCSTSSTGGDHDLKNSEKIVRYSFDCENLVCLDTSNIIDFNSGDYRSRTCVWNCGTGYNQCIKAQVTLKFEKVGGCWQLTHDQLSANYEGACK